MITHVEVMMYQAGCNRSSEILWSRLRMCSKKEALVSDYISSTVRLCHYLWEIEYNREIVSFRI